MKKTSKNKKLSDNRVLNFSTSPNPMELMPHSIKISGITWEVILNLLVKKALKESL